MTPTAVSPIARGSQVQTGGKSFLTLSELKSRPKKVR